jgi:hypothetical protein
MTLIGGYLLLHFLRVGPDIASVYVWSSGLIVVGVSAVAIGIWVLRQNRL